MQSRTLLAEVHGGQIVTETPLTEFEDKQVYVTLIALDVQPGGAGVKTEPIGAPVLPLDSEEAVVLGDAGRVRVRAREVTDVHIDFVDVERPSMRVYASDMED